MSVALHHLQLSDFVAAPGFRSSPVDRESREWREPVRKPDPGAGMCPMQKLAALKVIQQRDADRRSVEAGRKSIEIDFGSSLERFARRRSPL